MARGAAPGSTAAAVSAISLAIMEDPDSAVRLLAASAQLGYKRKQRKIMNNQFDELTKGLAQSVTRRQALRRFGVGLATALLASFGLVSESKAKTPCATSGQCRGRTRICHLGRCVSCVPSEVCDCSAPYGGCNFNDY